MLITKEIINELIAQAKVSPRLRANMDMRDSSDDTSQRMLNAIEPESIIPIHRHQTSSESVVCIKGSVVEYYHDDKGNITAEYTLTCNPGENLLQIPTGTWHSLKSLESGSVIFEVKNGAYVPADPSDIMNV